MSDQFEQIYTAMGGDPSLLASAKQRAQQTATPAGTPSLSGTLALLRIADLVDLHIAAKCGELSGLSCLCDEQVRRAYDILTARFTQNDLNTLFRAFCGCVVKPIQVPAPPVVAPAAYSPTPTLVTAPAPAATPTEICPTGLPAKATYTTMV